MVYHRLPNIQDLLLPPRCLLCGDAGAGGRNLCSGCLDDLPWNSPACWRCALPLPSDADAHNLCARCLRRAPPFDSALAALRYEPPLDFLVAGLKYRARLDHARLLGELLVHAVRQTDAPRPELLIPVPLHPRRLRERGFNQALELARPLARALNLPLARRGCRRVRATPRQTDLNARERRGNVRGAFSAGRVAGRRVAIVDDVVTTGHTVAELARTLRQAGAVHVQVWSAARAGNQATR